MATDPKSLASPRYAIQELELEAEPDVSLEPAALESPDASLMDFDCSEYSEEAAATYNRRGWTAEQLWSLTLLVDEHGSHERDSTTWSWLDPDFALACARSGLTASEAVDLRRQPLPGLTEYLAARETLRRTIDVTVASEFNSRVRPIPRGSSALAEHWSRPLWTEQQVTSPVPHWERLRGTLRRFDADGDLPTEVPVGDLALERAYQLWGYPDERGRFLVGVLRFEPGFSEDAYTYAGMHFEGIINKAVSKMGFPGRHNLNNPWYIDTHYELEGTYTLPNGITISAITMGVGSVHSVWRSDTATAREKANWANLPDPGQPAPSREQERLDELWDRVNAFAEQDFRTKSGSRFTYTVVNNPRIGDYGGVRIEVERGARTFKVSKGELGNALNEWPTANPLNLSGGYFAWALLADKRINP